MAKLFTQAELDLAVHGLARKIVDEIRDNPSPLVDLCALHLVTVAVQASIREMDPSLATSTTASLEDWKRHHAALEPLIVRRMRGAGSN